MVSAKKTDAKTRAAAKKAASAKSAAPAKKVSPAKKAPPAKKATPAKKAAAAKRPARQPAAKQVPLPIALYFDAGGDLRVKIRSRDLAAKWKSSGGKGDPSFHQFMQLTGRRPRRPVAKATAAAFAASTAGVVQPLRLEFSTSEVRTLEQLLTDPSELGAVLRYIVKYTISTDGSTTC